MSTGRRYSDRCDGVSALMIAVYQCRLIDISSQYNDVDDITLLHGGRPVADLLLLQLQPADLTDSCEPMDSYRC